MEINFFQWMRNGVKQAVLSGVSDAVEQIGLPPESEEASSDSLAFLRNSRTNSRTPAKTTGRKRLGKSLKDIESEVKK
ncbi:MAG: hypothetical protein COA78_19525 [Blastopirellula sp.]|nr:MAG: hypothetical protein COA78_19525 [Blastopirellula sp.]